MNEMQLLRNADPAAGAVPTGSRAELLRALRQDSAASDHARAPLGRYDAGADSPSLGRTRRRMWAAVAVVAALVAGSVTWQVLGVGRSGGASTAAAAVLTQAADAAIGARDPALGPDEYLQITTKAVYSVTHQAAGQQPLSWLDQTTSQEWVPGDPSRDWVQRREAGIPSKFFNPGDQARAAAEGQLAAPRAPELLRAHNGAFYGDAAGNWQAPTLAFLAELPRDPRQLLQRIYRDSKGEGQSKDGEALVFIADLLRCGFVAGDLRAALFRAATYIPGVNVTDKQANLDGRVGTAIGRDEGNTTRQELIFDPPTGQVIGERVVALDGSGTGIPSGETIEFTAVNTTVVSNLPTSALHP
jgi:hypothetical protein